MKNDAAKVTVLRHGAPVCCIDDDDARLLYVYSLRIRTYPVEWSTEIDSCLPASFFVIIAHRNARSRS